MTLYKVLDANGCSCNGGSLKWSLPTQNTDGTWTAGDWMPAIKGELVPCENGYHLTEDAQVLNWLGPRIFEAEYRGERVDAEDGDKLVVRECRLLREFTGWNERTARLFAVWCARGGLKLIANPDPRSVAVCNVAERYANGEATDSELSAARSAAWSAARSAARSAADAALDAARSAAQSAARSAADAALDAARSAALDAARSAAQSAAWSAAWSAARSALDAARSALDAARSAADAARSAARDAQYRQLCEVLA